MNNLCKITALLLSAGMLLCGCDKAEDKEPESSASESVSETEPSTVSMTAEVSTELTFPDMGQTDTISGEYVFDDAKVLSEKQRSEIYNNALYISRTFKINCAVVTAANLDGRSASEYAEEYYKKLYSGSNGVMFLINNDTGDDYILRKGAPANFVSNSDIEFLFAEISPMLVTEKYSEAATRVLELFAEKLPQYAVDRTNSLAKEEIESVNNVLSAASTDGKSISMIFIGTFGSKTVEEYAKVQYGNYSALSSDSNAIIVVNIQTGEYYICGGGSFAEAEKNQNALKSGISGCLTDTGTEKTFNCQKAAELFVGFMNSSD